MNWVLQALQEGDGGRAETVCSTGPEHGRAGRGRLFWCGRPPRLRPGCERQVPQAEGEEAALPRGPGLT